jgi:catechol 2,3-dioxygenase-like lactoylglutathione lyase family enzyme
MADDHAPRWAGVNHLALVTDNMDETVRFYHGVLGMPLVSTISVGGMRHYFFRIGPQSTVAFFQWAGHDVGRFEKPAGMPFTFAAQFDHVSFTLPDEDALEALRGRLIEYGTEVTDVVDHGFVHSVYFHDNNGIALEASWWVRDPTLDGIPLDDRQLFGDADPVPAVRELMETGDLGWTPATHLAGGLVDDPA